MCSFTEQDRHRLLWAGQQWDGTSLLKYDPQRQIRLLLFIDRNSLSNNNVLSPLNHFFFFLVSFGSVGAFLPSISHSSQYQAPLMGPNSGPQNLSHPGQ